MTMPEKPTPYDPAYVAHALGVAARAKGMTQISRRAVSQSRAAPPEK